MNRPVRHGLPDEPPPELLADQGVAGLRQRRQTPAVNTGLPLLHRGEHHRTGPLPRVPRWRKGVGGFFRREIRAAGRLRAARRERFQRTVANNPYALTVDPTSRE